MLFGASVEISNSTDYKAYCPTCKIGRQNVLVAMRPAYSADSKSTVIWAYRIPTRYDEFEVRGQVIGIHKKIVMYVKSVLGYVFAIN